jgi:hypothetical protein
MEHNTTFETSEVWVYGEGPCTVKSSCLTVTTGLHYLHLCLSRLLHMFESPTHYLIPLLMWLCSYMLEPPHCLHTILSRLCLQMFEPPHFFWSSQVMISVVFLLHPLDGCVWCLEMSIGTVRSRHSFWHGHLDTKTLTWPDLITLITLTNTRTTNELVGIYFVWTFWYLEDESIKGLNIYIYIFRPLFCGSFSFVLTKVNHSTEIQTQDEYTRFYTNTYCNTCISASKNLLYCHGDNWYRYWPIIYNLMIPRNVYIPKVSWISSIVSGDSRRDKRTDTEYNERYTPIKGTYHKEGTWKER